MAVLFAKTMTLAEYRDPHRAAEKAEMLEVWARFALFTLIAQIAAIETGGANQTRDDQLCFAHLRDMVGALAMLCALAAKVKRECAGRMGFTESCTVYRLNTILAKHACVSDTQQFEYFDTS